MQNNQQPKQQEESKKDSANQSDPLRITEDSKPQGLFWQLPRNPKPEDFYNFGRSDKDPFCSSDDFGVHQGNLMGPEYFQNFNPQQKKKEKNPFQIPPGARFDPFGPAPNFNTSYSTWENQKDRGFPPF